MLRFPVCTGLVLGTILVLSGCSGKSSSPAQPDLASQGLESAAQTPDSLLIPFDLTLNLETLSADITPRPERGAAAQGFMYGLDIANFMTREHLRVAGLSFTPTGDVRITFRHAHPFPAVNTAQPAVGLNRADLGYTGRLLILADGPTETFFSGVARLDPSLVIDPDGYVNPGDLLAQTGFTANTFPYMLLVDELKDNRPGISNMGVMSGSYNPAQGGWQQSNLGPNRTGWTGFDYLHGGQACVNSFVLRRSRVTGGPINIPLAVLIKYTDPKGVGVGSKRIPPATPEVTRFAYRLPHAALDCSRISGMNTPLIGNTAGSSAGVQFRIRDWDAQAVQAGDTDLSDEANVSLILPGTNSFPTVEISAPAFTNVPVTILPGGANTGVPGDELTYVGSVTNALGTAPGGPANALIRATDRDDGVLAAQNISYGVDPITLAGDPDRRLRVQTYQLLTFYVNDPGAPPTVISAGPLGTLGRVDDIVNFSAIATNGPTGWSWNFGGGTAPNVSALPAPVVQLTARGNHTLTVQASNGAGTSAPYAGNYTVLPFGWVQTWGSPQEDYVVDVAVAPSGNVYVLGNFQSSVDLDPGSGITAVTSAGGTDMFLSKFTPLGDFLWGVKWGSANALETACALRLGPGETPHVFMVFGSSFNADPKGSVSAPVGSTTSAGHVVVAVNSNGDYLRHAAWADTGWGSFSSFSGSVMADGSVLVCGLVNYSGVLGFDLDPGPGSVPIFTLGATYGYAVKLSSLMGYQWGVALGNPTPGLTTGVADIIEGPDGRVYFGGGFQSTVDFDPDLITSDSRTAVAGSMDAFLSVYSSAGVYQYTHDWGGVNLDAVIGLAPQATGFMVACQVNGSDPIDIDPSAGILMLTPSGQAPGTVYFSRYSTAAVPATLTNADALQIDGLLYGRMRVAQGGDDLTFAFRSHSSGTTDVDPGPGVENITDNSKPVLLLLSPAGFYQYHQVISGVSSTQQVMSGGRIPGGPVYFGGGFSGAGPVDFDPSPGYAENRTSAGGTDAFLVRYRSDLTW